MYDNSVLLVQSNHEHSLLIGRVLRIRNKDSTGLIEYKRSVSLAESVKFTIVKFTKSTHRKTKGGYVNQATNIGGYNTWAMIRGVKLQYKCSTKLYNLHEELHKFVTEYTGPPWVNSSFSFRESSYTFAYFI